LSTSEAGPSAVSPRSFSEAAAVMASAGTQGRPVRIMGGGTKLSWGGLPTTDATGVLWVKTSELSRVVIHEASQTATVNAGTTMLRAQSVLARSGLMIACDPQLGLGPAPEATVGGVVATADAGPLSHGYGPVREQIVAVTVALSDGSIVHGDLRSGPSEGGYELTRLLTGSFGTLGLILAVEVQLRPLPTVTATAVGSSHDAHQIREAASHLAGTYPELQALDIAWRDGRGGLLAQVAGEHASELAEEVAGAMRWSGLEGVAASSSDSTIWTRQRAGQRSADQAVLRVQARPSALPQILDLADSANAIVVGRTALGISHLTLAVNQIATVRAGLPADACAVLLDIPARARGTVGPWGRTDETSLLAMQHLKTRFDPAAICNPGVFVGGI
jgi:glycolate oxidase FAD binding subunit